MYFVWFWMLLKMQNCYFNLECWETIYYKRETLQCFVLFRWLCCYFWLNRIISFNLIDVANCDCRKIYFAERRCRRFDTRHDLRCHVLQNKINGNRFQISSTVGMTINLNLFLYFCISLSLFCSDRSQNINCNKKSKQTLIRNIFKC